MADGTLFTYSKEVKRPKKVYPGWKDAPEAYRATDKLVDAVNLAIFLRRPLLIEGEAGSGKSRLAYSVAYQLGLPLEVWPVRSTSKADEGLYRFDMVRRLYDAQADRAGLKDDKINPRDPSQYVEYGALGKAFRNADSPTVVLIDEIDKADLDFPNDLLNPLEFPFWFVVRETGERIDSKHAPIVIITSNKEKGNLPLPFLRRCVYYFIHFPDKEDELKDILNRHYQKNEEKLGALDSDLADAAIKRFLDIRKERLHKKPGVSELLDWVHALHRFRSSPLSPDALTPNRPVPFPELLYKLQTDLPTAAAQ